MVGALKCHHHLLGKTSVRQSKMMYKEFEKRTDTAKTKVLYHGINTECQDSAAELWTW